MSSIWKHTHTPLKPIKWGDCSHNENKRLNSDCWAPTATQTWEKNSSMKAALSMEISTSSSSWSHVCGIRAAVIVTGWLWRVMGILFVFVLRLECQQRQQHFRINVSFTASLCLHNWEINISLTVGKLLNWVAVRGSNIWPRGQSRNRCVGCLVTLLNGGKKSLCDMQISVLALC